MDRASKNVPSIALLGGVLLGIGVAVPATASQAAASSGSAGLFMPGHTCGPAEAVSGVSRPAFTSRVKADTAFAKAAARQQGVRTALRNGARSKAAKHAEARPSNAVRPAQRTPEAAPAMRPNVMRSFFACNTPTLPDAAAGTGWRLIGPLRRS